MKKLLPLLLCASLLLCACSPKKPSGASSSSVLVYRLISPEYQTSGDLLEAESVPLSEGEDAVSAAAAALGSAPESARLKSPIPPGVRILSAEKVGSEVTLELSAGYVLLGGIDKTILDYCITLTLCSISGVDSVSLRSGGGIVESGLRASDVLLQNTVKTSSEVKVRLYYPAERSQLRYEYRSLSIGEESSVERAVAEALLKGPESPLLYPALPAGTVLLSVYTQEGVCTLSLSEEFMTACGEQPDNATLWVYSLVNTLCSLSSVSSVSLLIEGKEVSSAGNCDVSRPLMKNDKLTGSPIM